MIEKGLLRIQGVCPCGRLSFSLNAFAPVSPLTSCVITSWGSMETLSGDPIITRCCSAVPISSGSAQMGFPILGRSVLFILDSVSQHPLVTSLVTSPKGGDSRGTKDLKDAIRSSQECLDARGSAVGLSWQSETGALLNRALPTSLQQEMSLDKYAQAEGCSLSVDISHGGLGNTSASMKPTVRSRER